MIALWFCNFEKATISSYLQAHIYLFLLALTSFCRLYCKLWTDFTHCSIVLIVKFEQAKVGWVCSNRLAKRSLKTVNCIQMSCINVKKTVMSKGFVKTVSQEFRKLFWKIPDVETFLYQNWKNWLYNGYFPSKFASSLKQYFKNTSGYTRNGVLDLYGTTNTFVYFLDFSQFKMTSVILIPISSTGSNPSPTANTKATTTIKKPDTTDATPVPSKCINEMKAVFLGSDGDPFIINKNVIYILNRESHGVSQGPINVNQYFATLNDVDAVFRRQRDSALVFFHGDKWVFLTMHVLTVTWRCDTDMIILDWLILHVVPLN